jgi:RHS repeat-associated protein
MNNAGSAVWLSEYKPYGELYGESGSVTIGDPNTTGIAWKPAFRFPGQYEDRETAGPLFYNHHRYYQPGLGNYTRPDPANQIHDKRNGRRIPTLPSYSYGFANPISMTDPSGLTPCCPCKGQEDALLGNLKRAIEIVKHIDKTGSIPAAIGYEGLTECWGEPGRGVYTVWIDPSLPSCIKKCVEAHENVHVGQCRRLGALAFGTLGDRIIELPAYGNELTCYINQAVACDIPLPPS